MRIALLLTYVGDNYFGWQIQKNHTTVQQVLTQCVSDALQERVKITGCGRTDTGVHALNYIASFDTLTRIPPEKLAGAINARLPSDIVIKSARIVSDSFHPVRDCVKKEYIYKLYTGVRNPFYEKRALHLQSIDASLISEGCKYFVGEHDFSSMRSLGTQVRSTVRHIYDCHIQDNVISITANGFLYNMARTIVGTLLSVSRGKLLPCDIADILQSRDRSRAGVNAPAYALYLNRVWYEELT